MTEVQLDRVGTKEEALDNAWRLLRNDPTSAAIQAREVINGDPECVKAHRILGMALRRTGDVAEARRSETTAINLAGINPRLFETAMALAENRLNDAEKFVRTHLDEDPGDPVALRMLAEVAVRMGHVDAARNYLKQCLAIAPDYAKARALREATERLPSQRVTANPSASARSTIGAERIIDDQGQPATTTLQDALDLHEAVVGLYQHTPQNWVSYGHVLRTVGRQKDAAAAYRRAIQEQPSFGEAWWALADLKTRSFDDADISEMARLLNDPATMYEDRVPLHFALAKALEQKGDYEESFEHYSSGNSLQGETEAHNRNAVTHHVSRSIEVFDQDYFTRRTGSGYDTREPIFILGMPRSGSTLLEQILATHPLIEGTAELPDIPQLADTLAGGGSAGFEDSSYLDNLVGMQADELKKFGQSYIWTTGFRRTTDRPRFLDKMPNNWLHVGLILSILPNAKIVDARRHPLACGFSNFKQHFAAGQAFTYDLANIGSFYRNYVRLMQHFDEILPGRVYRVIHEQLIDDPESELRRLFDYLELDFDPACLRFYENKRVVRTASSEQVRRPINREGVDQWRNFEPWLGELKEALGPLADFYPDVPDEIGRPN